MVATSGLRSSRPRILVVILADGAGGRLELLTENRAKPAVPYAGKYRLIDFAAQSRLHGRKADRAVGARAGRGRRGGGVHPRGGCVPRRDRPRRRVIERAIVDANTEVGADARLGFGEPEQEQPDDIVLVGEGARLPAEIRLGPGTRYPANGEGEDTRA